jgi:hypothetical protein
MRLRAGRHGFSTGARAFTLAVVVAASLAQFASLAHEMTVRHFRCAEHGELTHVAATMGEAAVAAPVTGDSIRAHDADRADAHEHCGVLFTLGSTASVPAPAVSGQVAAPPPAATPAAPPLASGREVALAAAPKTSPPRA